MAQLQGKVTGIEAKTSPKGNDYYRVQVGGIWLTTWDPPEFANGDTISYQIVQSGNFKNLADAKKVAGAVQSTVGGSVPTPSTNGPRDTTNYQRPKSPEEEARITRQNAFTSASSLVGALIQAQGPKGNWDLRKAFESSLSLAKEIFQVNMYGYPAPIAGIGPQAPKEAGADDLFSA